MRGRYEGIDGVADPGLVLDRRQVRSLYRLKGPVAGPDDRRREESIVPFQPLVDPGPQQADLFGVEPFSLRGHDLPLDEASHQMDESAVGTVPGDGQWLPIRLPKNIGANIKPVAGGSLFAAMTGEAAA